MGLLVRNDIYYSGGSNGKSAYTQAVEAGYSGTEAEFNTIMATARTRLTDLETDVNNLITSLASIVDVEEEEP